MRDRFASSELLTWYDAHARDLPWRVPPDARRAGIVPDPYRVWLSEIMLQQTTVAAVKPYFLAFTERWPQVTELAAADEADVMAAWAGLGYYSRARNLVSCARAVAADGGRFPETEEGLRDLPGIGPYTAAAIAAIAHDQPATVVDGNVERVMARLHRIETPLPAAKSEIKAAAAAMTPADRPGDYAQAVMDLGATICTPKSPICSLCPWAPRCAGHLAGVAATLPRKAPKVPKPIRHGIAYVVHRSDGAWLLETRPPRGLLGGMLGWPTTQWCSEPESAPPVAAEWHDPGAEVRHTFTHFHLRLVVRVALVDDHFVPDRGQFVSAAEFRRGDLPTVMRKVYDLAAPAANELSSSSRRG
ncbi:MAG: A/G-specific adenine glycosylase [Pseudomonadota bacterium]